MITAWQFEDIHHAMDLCKRIQNSKSEMIRKYNDPYGFELTYNLLLEKVNESNNPQERRTK